MQWKVIFFWFSGPGLLGLWDETVLATQHPGLPRESLVGWHGGLTGASLGSEYLVVRLTDLSLVTN